MSTNTTWADGGLAVTNGKDLDVALLQSGTIGSLKTQGLDVTANADISANPTNGATASGGKITIPPGQTGMSSYCQAWIKAIPDGIYIGQKLTFILFVNHSKDFIAQRGMNGNINVFRNGVNQIAKRDAVRFTFLSSTLTKIEVDYTVVDGDASFVVYAQIPATTNTSPATMQLDRVLIQNLKTFGVVKKTIKQDGTGDYTTLASAFAAVTDSSPVKWYEFTVYPGTYAEIGLNLPPYTRVIGMDKKRCWIKGELASSSTDAQITPTSTLNVQYEFELRNLKITGKNCRYAIHSESNGVTKDVKHTLKNCHIEHFGNQEAIDYRTANPGSGLDPNTVWKSYAPYGYGSSSGIYAYFDNVVFKSPNAGWYVHNRETFSKPNINHLKNCRIINGDSIENKNVVAIQQLGSGTNDQIILEGVEGAGVLSVDDNPWIPTDLASQYANHNNFEISGYCNTPMPYFNNTLGQALRFTSNTTTGTSQVRLSGTAVNVLLGEITYFDGKGGLKGYGYGRYDVSDMLIGLNKDTRVSGMFRRLGNCTANPVTLTVQFESQTPVDIVFNEDYTIKDNTYILNKINTALGTQGVADLFNPAKWDRPRFRDERLTLRNMSANGMPRYSAVKKSTILGGFDVMSSTDDVDDFLGFVEEDVNPGETGTIKIKGYLTADDVLKDGTVNFAKGNYIAISTTVAGKVINTVDKTKAIGKGVSASYFNIKL